jgi:hypothetical protein
VRGMIETSSFRDAKRSKHYQSAVKSSLTKLAFMTGGLHELINKNVFIRKPIMLDCCIFKSRKQKAESRKQKAESSKQLT